MTTPAQFTCENCGHPVPWMDAGLYHYEHRNQCPHCMYSKHIMFGTTTLPPCDGLMGPVGVTNTTPPFLITECEPCGFCWATYDEDHWATLEPHHQTALINQAYEQTERENLGEPTIIYAPKPEYRTPPPPIPQDQLTTRKRVTRRP